MEPWITGLVVAAAGALSAGGAWITARIASKKVPSETASILTETALSLVEPLRDRVSQLETRVDELEQEVFNERRERLWREMHNAALIEELRALGVAEPVTLEEIRRMYPHPEQRKRI